MHIFNLVLIMSIFSYCKRGDHCKIFSGCLFVHPYEWRDRTRGCMNNNVFVKFVVTRPISYILIPNMWVSWTWGTPFFSQNSQPFILRPGKAMWYVESECVCVWFTVRVFLVIKSISMCGFVVVGTCSVDWMGKVSRSAKFNLAFVVVAADIFVVIL